MTVTCDICGYTGEVNGGFCPMCGNEIKVEAPAPEVPVVEAPVEPTPVEPVPAPDFEGTTVLTSNPYVTEAPVEPAPQTVPVFESADFESAPEPTIVSSPVDDLAQQYAEPSAYTEDAPKKKKLPWWAILLIILGALFILGIIGIILFFVILAVLFGGIAGF